MPTQAIKQRFVRGIINWSSSENATLEQNTKLTLNGIVFESLKFPAILMRRNKGITFDLNAIRQDNPGANIERFAALCGISESDSIIAGNGSRADFYVLVDGQERYVRKDVSANSGGEPLSVRIYPENRYLTLIVAFSKITDNGVNRALFGMPTLEFEAK